MNTQSSFSLNPNSAMSEGGSLGASEGFFWDSHLWPFGNLDHSAAPDAGNGGGGDGKGKEKAVVAKDKVSDEIKEISGGSMLVGKRKAEADMETHIYTERERRKKMRNMFSNLHAMLPQLPPKTDKTTIVDEAVKHIKTLETQLQMLQDQKANKVRCATNAAISYEPLSSTTPRLKLAGVQTTRESFLADHAAACLKPQMMSMAPVNLAPVMFHTWTSPNVVLNTFGQEAQIMICSPRKLGLFTAVTVSLEKHMIEVESATVSSDGNGNFYMIQVRLASGAIELCPDSFSAEGVFKQAVRELMLLFPCK